MRSQSQISLSVFSLLIVIICSGEQDIIKGLAGAFSAEPQDQRGHGQSETHTNTEFCLTHSGPAIGHLLALVIIHLSAFIERAGLIRH